MEAGEDVRDKGASIASRPIYNAGGKSRLTFVRTWKFVFVLFINYCVLFLYYSSKPTFATPVC